MADMTGEEWRAFLGDPVRTATLATVRPEGRAVRADPRVALCVDDDRPPFSYVMVEGLAEASRDPDQLLRWATRLGGRYMGEERAEASGRRNAVSGELLVRVRPTRVVARTNVAD